jgi:hypothetical protein
LNALERRSLVNDHSTNPDDFEVDADDLPPIDDIEYEESDGFETAVELELLLGRVQGTRFADA